MSARSSATVSNSELSAAHSSVTSGSFLTLTSLTRTRNEIGSSVPGAGAVKARISPLLTPRSWSSSSATTVPLPTS